MFKRKRDDPFLRKTLRDLRGSKRLRETVCRESASYADVAKINTIASKNRRERFPADPKARIFDIRASFRDALNSELRIVCTWLRTARCRARRRSKTQVSLLKGESTELVGVT